MIIRFNSWTAYAALALLQVMAGSPRVSAGPALIRYSTFLGGDQADEAWGAAVAGSGDIYLAGATCSLNFPTFAAVQPSLAANWDGFVAGFGSGGNALFFSTFLGGSLDDRVISLVLDPLGSPCVIGYTVSADFPTRQAVQATKGGGSYDAFVSVLSSAGSCLDFSSYLGGGDNDAGRGIAADSLGRIYIAGYTSSADFPTLQPYQASRAGIGKDGFVSIVDPAVPALISSTYLGGSADDDLYAVAVDGALSFYVAGNTASTDYPTRNCYQASQADAGVALDAVITRFAPGGSALVFSGYLGGADRDSCAGLAVGAGGDALLTGFAWSVDFPTRNAYQAAKGSAYNYDAFVAKLETSGALSFSTYLGGGDRDEAHGIACDSAGAILITGQTFSFNFPVLEAFQGSHAGALYSDDVFVSSLASSGSRLIFSSYLGGSSNEIGYAVAFGSDPDAYVAGWTSSFDFPTREPYQASMQGDREVFLCRIAPPRTPSPSPSSSPSPTPSLTPSPSPSPSPSPTATPTPTATASPSPSPTVRRCFSVAGKVSEKASAQAIAGALVRIAVPDGRSSVVLADGDGNFAASVCTHIPDGQLLVQARHRDYLPFQSESSYADWSAPGRHEVSLAQAAKLQGMAGGDYDGDGTADLAVYRPGLGFWAVRDLTRAFWGVEKDEPCPGDYDGDGTAELAVFRAGTALWAIRDLTRAYFGDFVDLPVPADYDGEGTASIAVFRSTSGLWAVRGGTREIFGIPNDQPVPGRYNINGGASPAIYRSGIGYWSVRSLSAWYFGAPGDRVVPGDYDGEGYWRPAVQRPGNGLWAVWGGGRWTMDSGPSLRALPADYNGDGLDEAATFLDSSGRWRIRELTAIHFGMTGDLPAVR